jgi:hypothetical protein
MQVPLEIAFHNMDSSDWAEQEIRTRVAELERIFDRLVSCRVRIDQRNKSLTAPFRLSCVLSLAFPGGARSS